MVGVFRLGRWLPVEKGLGLLATAITGHALRLGRRLQQQHRRRPMPLPEEAAELDAADVLKLKSF